MFSVVRAALTVCLVLGIGIAALAFALMVMLNVFTGIAVVISNLLGIKNDKLVAIDGKLYDMIKDT